MADDPFLDDLTTRLRDYGNDLALSVLPGFKSSVQSLRSVYDSLISLLSKKGLLSEDPYQFSEKISEIKPVANEPFLESQKQSVVSIRMHNFESQLAFLAEYYQFSLDYLTLGRLKAISQLLRYVKWDSLTENSNEQNTKLVAELVGRVRKGDDSISAGLVNDMVTQMMTHSSKAFDGLKKLTFWKREEYKVMLRTSFWPSLNVAAEEVMGNLENVQRKIKKEFALNVKGQPFIPELIKELLDEDFSPQSAPLREELLTKLRVARSTPDKPKTTVDPRVELMEAVRTLSSYNLPLDAALRKLNDNAALLDITQISLGERFQRWLRKLMGVKSKPRVFVIDLIDPVTGATRQDRLEFDPFLGECQTRSRVLATMAVRSGPSFLTLSQKTEDEILAWFERQFIEAAKIVERLNGLDIFFKTEVPKERRAQVKGIKAEVAQIRTGMNNANKQRHEAVARREEQEQLKRLGIKP